MKKIVQLIILLLNANCMFGQTNVYDSIFVNSRWRTYMTHLPIGYSSSTNYSLVLAFHGGGSPSYQTIQYQSRLSEKADSASFIVVYPEGISIGGIRTWNAGGCCPPATTLKINDIGFVNTLLDKLFNTRPIDTKRVYATGFSNGALLCYRLADQLPNRFAAIAPVEGDLVYYPWNPSKAVPIISFHSYLDPNIPYYGGLTVGPSGLYYAAQDSIFNIISSNYSCSVLKDTLYHNVSQYDHFKYSNCSCNSVIEQYVSYDGEHSWAGGLAISGKPVSTQFSATYLMWRFFQNYTTRCGTTGLFDIESKKKKLQIFPNPTDNFVTIDLPAGRFTISIFYQTGKKANEQLSAGGKFQINCSELTQGLYFVQARSEKETLTCKFIKQ